ncbi:MAG: type transport system ATP-binding protein, partial [Actinomycetota bacterium]|nr:type transport system ATP-binding protein [Actinomycetota bacterium]
MSLDQQFVPQAQQIPAGVSAVEVHMLRKEFGHKKLRSKKKGPKAALRDVSFTLPRGECVAILGPNGSGKSTLIRILSTLLIPDGGSARVFGFDVTSEPKQVRRLVNRV